MSRESSNDVDAWYRKYSPDGQLFWDQALDGEDPNDSRDGCYRIAVDSNDALLIACWTEPMMNGTQAHLGKYDQNGAEIWVDVFGTPSDDQIYGVGVGPEDSVVAVGHLGYSDAFIRRYTADGSLEWERTFSFGQNTRGRDVEFLADGRIAMVIDPGRRARLYTGVGAEVWTFEEFVCNAIGLAADGNDVVVAGCSATQPDVAWFAGLSGVDGSLDWEHGWAGDPASYASDVAIDSMGRIIAVGYRSMPNQGFLFTTRKYTADGGSLIWEQTINGPDNGTDVAFDVAVDSNDNVLVAGYLQNPTDWDAIVVKYAS